MSTLAGHRIARIETAGLPYHYPRPVGRNSHLGAHGTGGTARAVIVRTDSGASGWGLTAGDGSGLAELVGRRLEDLFQPEVGVTDDRARPLDLALHDLAGHLLEQPVFELLGDGGARPVPCYSGAIYLDDLDPAEAPRGIEAVLANCRADHRAGFRAFKLKIGRGYRWMERAAGLRRDIEVTRAVRGAFPDAHILVDANNGYSGEGFLDYLDAVADCGLFWIEEPFQETREDLGRLRSRLDQLDARVLVADGELRPDVPFLLELAAERLLDVLLMDVVEYGFTAWRRLLPTLRRLGVQASPHAWGQPLKSLYAAQLAAGLGNVVTVEGVPGATDGVDAEGYRLDGGVLHVPDAPGFGLGLPAAGTQIVG